VNSSDITAALVSRLVATQFPQWADLSVKRVELDGNDNTTFRLGEDMSVRLPSADRYVLQIDKEHRWLPVLANHLPLPIPKPLAKGVPGFGYPRPWSVYRWLEGEPATPEAILNQAEFATDLADFLAALYGIDPIGGPPPGEHNFFRGGPLATYDRESRGAITALANEIDGGGAADVWDAALGATWRHSPVWIHGDVSAGNLLVDNGRLSAVIDFGSLGVGDPACDVTIAWTFLSGNSREAFRGRLPVDEATWARGRGWALWKAMITLVQALEDDLHGAVMARRVIKEVLAEHKAGRRSS
jgi:aminoglycoside phosphotransferase (APT) family kinase protein